MRSNKIFLPVALLLHLSCGFATAAIYNWNTSVSSGGGNTLGNWVFQSGTTTDPSAPWADPDNIFYLTTGSGTVTATGNASSVWEASLYIQQNGRLQPTAALTVKKMVLDGGTIYRSSGSSGQNISADSTIYVESNSTIWNFMNNNSFVIAAPISGAGRIETLNNTTSSVSFTGNNSNFSGGWLVSTRTANFSSSSLGTGTIATDDTSASTEVGIARLNADSNWSIANNLAGKGRLQIGATTSSSASTRTLTLEGSRIDPGFASPNPPIVSPTAGILTIQNSNTPTSSHVVLALGLNPDLSPKQAELAIDVVGTGNAAGVDFDQLFVTRGNLSGLANAKLTVNFHGLNADDLNTLSPSITIVSLGNGIISGTFAPEDITFTGGIQANTITYNSNSIVLSNFQAVPEPSTWALLALGGMALAGRRLRGRRAK